MKNVKSSKTNLLFEGVVTPVIRTCTFSCWILVFLNSSAEVLCWTTLLNSSVEILCWLPLLNYSLSPCRLLARLLFALHRGSVSTPLWRIFWGSCNSRHPYVYFLLLTSSVEFLCWTTLLNSSAEFLCWFEGVVTPVIRRFTISINSSAQFFCHPFLCASSSKHCSEMRPGDPWVQLQATPGRPEASSFIDVGAYRCHQLMWLEMCARRCAPGDALAHLREL